MAEPDHTAAPTDAPAMSPERASMRFRPERWEPVAFLVIVLVAIALRFWAIDFGFPEHVRPDEQYFVTVTRRFDENGTLDPNWYFYPSLYMYINCAVWRAYTMVHFFRGHYAPPDGRQGQRSAHGIRQIRERPPNIEYLLGRCVTALFGIATVLVLYGLARRSYGRKAAVAAAFLLAVNGLHVLNSHFYKNDVATTFFTVAALACMARYVREERIGWNLGAAVCTGLAIATNYYGGFLLVPLVVSQFLGFYRDERRDAAGPDPPVGGRSAGRSLGERTWTALRPAVRGLARWELYAMPALALVVFVAASPYCFIRWPQFLNTFHRMVFADRQSLYDTLVRQIQFDDYGFATSPLLYSLRFCWRHSMGLVLSVVSAIGLVFLVARRPAVGSLLVLFFAIHFLGVASGKAVFMRYYLSLVPILTLGAAVALSWGVQKAAPRRPDRQNLLLAVALVVCGAESAWVSVQQNRLLGREDTRVEARRWLAKNLPGGAAVGTPVDWWGDVYPYGKPTLPPGSRYIPVAPGQVRAKRLRYLLIDDSLLRLYSPPKRPRWTQWLEANARMLHEISPYDRPVEDVRARYDQLDAFYVPVAGFRGITRPGPHIRIYAVSTPR